MSDRIIQSFSDMKNIYLTQILTEEKEEDEDYGEKYEKNYKKTGKKSKDCDGEVEDEADEYAGVKDKAIRKAMGEDEEDEEEKPKLHRKHKHKRSKREEDDEDMKTESFSNWRNDLYEVISTLENEPKLKDIGNEQITEKPVRNKVVINPPVTEKFAHVFTQELDEDFIIETADVAADYFVSLGLNEYGIELVMEELGLDKFIEYVFYIAEETLLTEGHNEISKRIIIDRGNRYVSEAVNYQRKTKRINENLKNRLAKFILTGIENHKQSNANLQRGIQAASQRHNDAIKLATPVAQKLLKGAGQAASGFVSGIETAAGKRNLKTGELTSLGKKMDDALNKKPETKRSFGKKITDEDRARNRARSAKRAAKKRAKRQTNESIQYILEKAVSEQQQKLFGLALSVKRGQTPRSEVSSEVLKIVDTMSTAEIRKFAGTKHKGLPHSKEE